MTADAIGKDLRYGLGKLGDLDRFGRSGIVTDKQWLAALAEFFGKLVPGNEVRAFGPDGANAALGRVAAGPPPEVSCVFCRRGLFRTRRSYKRPGNGSGFWRGRGCSKEVEHE